MPGAAQEAAVRRARLARLRSLMARHDMAAVVLVDPVNVRYATGTCNMQIFSARNPARYVFVALDGPAVLFEFAGCLAHGIGMTGEYPYLVYSDDFAAGGYDGVIEPGMVLCVESFIGAEDGGEGVKLEQQVHVTEDGNGLMSSFPFDERLLAREV